MIETEKIVIEYNDDITKVLPICLYPINRNGIFKTNVKIPRGTFVKWLEIMDIPTIPPSIILFGTRKISKPTAAINDPRNSRI
jgi:hypothetical protein